MKTLFSSTWHFSLKIFRENPSLLLPLALGRFIKYLILALIANPLIQGYQQANSVNKFIHYLDGRGIDLTLPEIYIILLFLYFVSYCIATLLFHAELNSLLLLFQGKKANLRQAMRQLRKNLKQLLSWCLINKTWGALIRLWNALFKFISFKDSSTTWPIANLFTLALIFNKEQTSLEAMKNSKLIVEQHFGNSPSYSWALFKPLLSFFLLACIPLCLGFLLNNEETLWIGFLISLGLWYCVSLLESCLHLILFSVFYEYIVNGKLIAGFKEEDLQKAVLIRASS